METVRYTTGLGRGKNSGTDSDGLTTLIEEQSGMSSRKASLPDSLVKIE
jgi:hypothetical protein